MPIYVSCQLLQFSNNIDGTVNIRWVSLKIWRLFGSFFHRHDVVFVQSSLKMSFLCINRTSSPSWVVVIRGPKSRSYGKSPKEVCNGGVACSLLKPGSLEKTVIAAPFYSGLHSGTIFCAKNEAIHHVSRRHVMSLFLQKKTKECYGAKLIFWSYATFFDLTFFRSGAKLKFLLFESMSPAEMKRKEWTKSSSIFSPIC